VQVNNFNFSQEEVTAINERAFFLVKNSATKKVMELFGAIESEMKLWIRGNDFDIADLNISSGKIFRGENYKLFPYILLDYPRLFSKESIFSFRTMFWWGHEFSFTLHMEGAALDKNRNSLIKNIETLKDKNVFFCIHDSPWQYDFSKENYLPLEDIENIIQLLNEKSFIKISRKLPSSFHEEVFKFSLETFQLFLSLIKEKK
jgi:hypothetical protein